MKSIKLFIAGLFVMLFEMLEAFMVRTGLILCVSQYGQQFQFGTGIVIATPSGANATPIRLGTVQDVTMDITYATKLLRGQNQLPIAIARGAQDIKLKLKFAQLVGNLFSSLVLGGTPATGQTLLANQEAHAIPATPYTVSVTNSATAVADQGVQYTSGAAAGTYLTRVAASPVTGQYSYAAGVYTFAAADTLLNVAISYTYTEATTGNSMLLANQTMGTTPVFQLVYAGIFDGRQAFFQFNAAVANKMAFAPKLEDFTFPEIDVEIMNDSSGNIGTFSFGL